jgi:hypothetical protein
MPKNTFAVVFFILIAAGAFGADSAAGVSVAGGYSIGIRKASLAALAVSSQTVDTSVPLSVSAFGDFRYVFIGVGVGTELLRQQTASQAVGTVVNTVPAVATGSRTFFMLTVLAEIPFTFGAREPYGPLFTLAPLAGIEADICLAALDANGNDATVSLTNSQRSDLNELWLKAGAELQIPLSTGISLRPWFLAGFKLLNVAENNVYQNVRAAGLEPLFLSLRAQAGLALGFEL